MRLRNGICDAVRYCLGIGAIWRVISDLWLPPELIGRLDEFEGWVSPSGLDIGIGSNSSGN